MSVNKYKSHLLVLPEDDANEDIVNGFILNTNIDVRTIFIEPVAHGWPKVITSFVNEYIPRMRKYTQGMMVLPVDFDEQVESRLKKVKDSIPADLEERVFILGVQSEPEKLKSDLLISFEEIGKSLAKECENNTEELWGHDLLKHNAPELKRMLARVKPFLFFINN